MAKVERKVIVAFGVAVRDAKVGKGWTHTDLDEAMQGGIDKSHLSGIENGKRAGLKPVTVSRLVTALDMDKGWIECFTNGAPPPALPEPEEDTEKRKETAEKLEAKARKDQSVAPVAEALLTTLAYEFAGGEYRDLHTAYTSLRQALQAAEDIRKRGEMPPDNTGSQLNAVMAEVATLNDQGKREEADALLDAEEARMREAHKAEKDRLDQQAKALLDRRLDQDRLRNRPDEAAKRLIADLHRQAPAGGVFWATDRLSTEWRNDGDATGDMFALQVALELAKANYAKAKGKKPLEAAALNEIGLCHWRLAERSSKNGHLRVANNAFEAALKKTNKKANPLNWAALQGNRGSVLREMGTRTADPALLETAVVAHKATLDLNNDKDSEVLKNTWECVGIALQSLGEITRSSETLREAEQAISTALSLRDKTADPLDWAKNQSNLALAQRWLGAVTKDLSKLDEARQSYANCEALDYEQDAPFNWAVLQWNIADLALARFHLDPDPAHLIEARTHLAKARAFFIEGSEYQTEKCDDLLAQIDAADPAKG